MNKYLKYLIFFTTLFLLTSCFSNFLSDGAPKIFKKTFSRDAVPRKEPLSEYGNGDEKGYYEVRGKRYRVLSSAGNYKERGIASWYGTKFHGRLTSNREIYNIYAMTAAHKSLPLPTYVKVTNTNNKKTVVVRVNDRGPFVDDRIIDLSYAAALKLDMVKNGTAPVIVETISEKNTSFIVSDNIQNNSFVQVGAFDEEENAYNYLELLKKNRFNLAFVKKEYNWMKPLTPSYLVQIGPIQNAKDYDKILSNLKKIGVYQTTLIQQ